MCVSRFVSVIRLPRRQTVAYPDARPKGTGMSTTALGYPHIEQLSGEPPRLERLPSVRVSQIVMDYLAHGWSTDEICRQHSYLRSAEVHAAMTYYFDHLYMMLAGRQV